MPARSVAQTTLHFGLVSVPVKLYSTTNKSDDGIKFSSLHDACGGRLQQKSFCTKCEKIVEQDSIIRGYEHAKGQYITLTADELAALDAVATNSIAINEYVPHDTIDPLVVEKSFYVGPDKGGEPAFRLLWSALVETGMAAIGPYSAHRRQTIVAIRPHGELLALHQLRYAHEIVPAAEVPPSKATTPDAETLQMAKLMVMRGARKLLELDRYRDEVQARIVDTIARKVEDGTTIEAPPKVPVGKVVDLKEALRASLEGGNQP